MMEGESPDRPVDRQAPSGEPDAHLAAYRCFLFADLRGYTSFMERAGNAAGVELLGDYARIVRAEVARYHGAEIKVEGDGFHVVFPSASSAVMCGLAIVDAAAEANSAHPDRPIDVGIGVHAGEALETPDGYIGAAVNIAARVCALAQAGEVLVTGTVRDIAAASVPVGFVARGRERLKGISEPVELFAVSRGRDAGAVGRRALPSVGVAAAAIAIASLSVLAFYLATRPSAGPTTSASAGPSTPGNLLDIGPLTVGSYRADQFVPPFGFVITDPGWVGYRNSDDYLGLRYDSEPKGQIDVATIHALYTDPCIADGQTVPVGSTALDLVSAMQGISYLEVGVPERLEIGGRSGQSVDITVSEGALAACASFGSGDVALFPAGTETWRADSAERFRLEALDVDGATVAFLLSSESSAAGSVQEFETFLELAERVVKSVDF